ncbi:kinase-like domain-containing protein [Chlamydoabsidia padenii]|nr:kinase-like domain-containing protein [Chlamydoabsidia padenii]
MSQPSLQNPLSMLKTSTPTTQPTLDSSFALTASQQQSLGGTTTSAFSRSRAGSIIKSMMIPSSSPSPSPSRRPSSATHSMKAKRAASGISEALHLKLSALAVHDVDPSNVMAGDAQSPPYTPFDTTTTPLFSPLTNASATSLSQVSETNWTINIDDFDIKEPIGYGSSAIVYNAIYLPMKKMVALKVIDLDMFERNQIDELRRETALMALSKHPNVLKVHGSFVNGSKLYIITPYLAFGSCLDIMKTNFKDGFEEMVITTILKQALEGLVYLHNNGHIHRDVKAGNLLMDDQGTVLLADFGVSSSLTEKGDVRKTFVGTPCWMAPEVMEQDGYDYKADIWSFGITSIELATGHAPYAKYPPMKVLKLTLSNASPTLDLDHTKHKYSKLFKEMIDLCLQKNPSNRPSAEKLLQHPFFKQAKKKEYLCKSVLSHINPVDQRPRRKMPEKRISYESTDHWDFDDTPDAKQQMDQTFQEIDQQQQMNKPHVVTTPPPPPPPSSSQQTKRRITFGEVVVRDNSTSVRSKSPSISDVYIHPNTLPDNSDTTAPTKKSRFIVEDLEPGGTTPNSIMLPSNDNTDYISYGSSSSNKEGRQHRYSVQFSGAEYDRTHDSILTASSSRYTGVNGDSPLSPLSRVSSYDCICERKSRFEVQHPSSNTLTTATMVTGEQQQSFTPISISRESSQSSLQPQKLGRFSVEKTSNNEAKEDARKIGRFELTGRSSTSSSTDGSTLDSARHYSVSNPVDQHALYPQMELLLKQMEAQKSVLQDMMTQLSPPRSRAVSISDSSPKRRLDSGQQQDQQQRQPAGLQETVDHLQKLLAVSKCERDRLVKENEELRLELEQYRK